MHDLLCFWDILGTLVSQQQHGACLMYTWIYRFCLDAATLTWAWDKLAISDIRMNLRLLWAFYVLGWNMRPLAHDWFTSEFTGFVHEGRLPQRWGDLSNQWGDLRESHEFTSSVGILCTRMEHETLGTWLVYQWIHRFCAPGATSTAAGRLK